MSKVVFKSKVTYLSVAHEELFHCGIIQNLPYKQGVSHLEVDVEQLREMGVPAPEKYNSSYEFAEGEECNRLTLETDEEIEAMREYMKHNKHIVELELIDGGWREKDFPYGANRYVIRNGCADRIFHSTELLGHSVDDSKSYNFIAGEYYTEDPREIEELEYYIAHTQNPVFVKGESVDK